MKNRKYLLILLFIVITVAIGIKIFVQNSEKTNIKLKQDFSLENGKYKFAFYKNNSVYISSTEGEIVFSGPNIKIKKDKIFKISREYSYQLMPKDVLIGMHVADGLEFYSAIQSMDDSSMWLFVERNMLNVNYNVWFYENESNTKKLIFSQLESPEPKYAFIPFVWYNNTVYFEARDFNNMKENEGIWYYNLDTKNISKLAINSSYRISPFISPDRKHFIYCGTTESENHDPPSNAIFVYNIAKNNEIVVAKDEKTNFRIFGWMNDKTEISELLSIEKSESYY